ncbi:hypothetical protein VTO42DRAFT_6109 [Malbranchea cinnamomea]
MSQTQALSKDQAVILKRPRTEKDLFIEHWVKHDHQWPKGFPETDPMAYLFARSKSLRRTKSNTSLNTLSESNLRGAKSSPYSNKKCEVLLEASGGFMKRHENGVSSSNRTLCQELLEKKPDIPKGTKFDDNVFEATCERIQRKNEIAIIRKIADLIVPLAENAIDLGFVKSKHLVESVNEAWNNSIPFDETQQLSLRYAQSRKLTLPQPQPDYAVGFSRQAFTDDQLCKSAPFLGGVDDTSFFMGTAYMYFPFFTSEVKCGKSALDIADRQNAHSMTLAVRGVVELFKLVKREQELHREILAFSMSHDHRMVRIYGHYPIIDGEKTFYYRHSIHEFSFIALDGKERWTSYRFTLSVYNDWVPSHFERLCSAIDDLPKDISF